jgi:hypothetical protein
LEKLNNVKEVLNIIKKRKKQLLIDILEEVIAIIIVVVIDKQYLFWSLFVAIVETKFLQR